MKNILLYFVMLICVVFIVLPPLLRIVYNDGDKEKIAKESASLTCRNASSDEIIKVIYNKGEIRTFIYHYNATVPVIKPLVDAFSKAQFVIRDYSDESSITASLFLDKHPADLAVIPEEFKGIYSDVQKKIESYQFTCLVEMFS